MFIQSDEHEMEVDTASSTPPLASSKHVPVELEIYCYFIVLLFLIDQKKYTEVMILYLSLSVRFCFCLR